MLVFGSINREKIDMSQKRYTPELIIGMLRKKVEQESSTSAIAALGGWDNLKQVETYTKSARRRKSEIKRMGELSCSGRAIHH